MKLFKKNILSNNKGITIIFVALLAFVLFAFAALAVDVAYFYVAKNELQVAADAAALAGAAKVTGTIDSGGTPPPESLARQEAWKFACRNRAAGSNVYLVASGTNCDSPPAATALNSVNAPTGDIVVGHWTITIPSTLPSGVSYANCAQTGSGYFCPSTGSTGLAINAIKTRPRRSGPVENPDTPGMPPVGVFFGRFLGWDWMNIGAEAIASMPPRASAYFTMCETFCSGCTYPSVCSTERELRFSGSGERFQFTTLTSSPASTSTVEGLICKSLPYADVCDQELYTTGSAESVRDFESVFYDPSIPKSTCPPMTIPGYTCTEGLDNGWWVIIPIVKPQNPSADCGSDLSNSGTSKIVTQYALVRVTSVCAPGEEGCRGFENPSKSCTTNNVIVFDRISCISCDIRNRLVGLKPALVR